MKRLTDGERDILREQERDAREFESLTGTDDHADDWTDLYESADCLEDVFEQLLAANDKVPPVRPDDEIPF